METDSYTDFCMERMIRRKVLNSEGRPWHFLYISSWKGVVNASEAASPLREKCLLVPQTALTRGFLNCSLGVLSVALSSRPMSSCFLGFFFQVSHKLFTSHATACPVPKLIKHLCTLISSLCHSASTV